jgi:hypothetical protein
LIVPMASVRSGRGRTAEQMATGVGQNSGPRSPAAAGIAGLEDTDSTSTFCAPASQALDSKGIVLDWKQQAATCDTTCDGGPHEARRSGYKRPIAHRGLPVRVGS